MKKTGIYLLLIFMALHIGSCEKTDDGSYVAPITVYEKVYGSWTLSSLKMVDEYAKANSIKPDEQDLSNWFNFSEFTIELNVDANNEPTTYKVNGDVPELFLPEGFWSLSASHPQTDLTPIAINLYANSAKNQLADQLFISSIPGANNELEFKLIRKANQVPYLSYVFKLIPATLN